MGITGILGSSVESLNPLKNFSPTMNLDHTRKARCCPSCSNGFEQEVEKLKELEKPPDEVKSNLPQWLQNAKPKDQSQVNDDRIICILIFLMISCVICFLIVFFFPFFIDQGSRAGYETEDSRITEEME